jgi:hypothetical protein
MDGHRKLALLGSSEGASIDVRTIRSGGNIIADHSLHGLVQ